MPSPDVLVFIDCIHTLEFDGADQLLEPYLRLAAPLGDLADRARKAGIPVIWANDHFGQWNASLADLVRQARAGRGRPFLDRVQPLDGDLHVLKPRHSAFFQTSLEALLRTLEVRRLILCGVQAHSCVLFTAHDAHMWEYELAVPADGVASERPEDVDAALHVVRRVMHGDTRPCSEFFQV